MFDNAHSGRTLRESWVDPLDGTAGIVEETTLEYRDAFLHGLIQWQTTRRSVPGGARLSTTQATRYDPVTRRLTATATDDTGRVVTQTWDFRWESPVETLTGRSITTNRFNRMGTVAMGVAVFEIVGAPGLGTAGLSTARLLGEARRHGAVGTRASCPQPTTPRCTGSPSSAVPVIAMTAADGEVRGTVGLPDPYMPEQRSRGPGLLARRLESLQEDVASDGETTIRVQTTDWEIK